MADPADRRQSERFPVTPSTTCEFAGQVVQDLGAVRIKNVSMEGIGLFLSRPVQPGSLLALKIQTKSGTFSRVLLIKVAHVTPQVGGTVLVGGTFDAPLTYQEFTSLVM